MKRSVVFLGTPNAAVVVLEALVSQYNVELVITQPDKKRGRGSALIASPVKVSAQSHGIPVAYDLGALDHLPVASNRMYVVVAFGRIIPSDVLERYPMLNVHFSLLPRWRGAAPVERAIMAGDATTGVCIMQIEPALDTGPVYVRAETAIEDSDTAEVLTHRLAHMGADLLSELLAAELGSPMPQSGEPTYAHKIENSERLISWHGTSTDIWRRVRAIPCYTMINAKRVGIVEVEDLPQTTGEIGVITPEAVVFAEHGALRLRRVRPEGKNVMAATDWLRGIAQRDQLRCDTQSFPTSNQ